MDKCNNWDISSMWCKDLPNKMCVGQWPTFHGPVVLSYLEDCYEPSHEIMVLFILRKLILQTRMPSHPVGLDVWFLVGPFNYFHTLCMRTAKALVRLWMGRLAWAFAGRLCAKYHNLMSWLIWWMNVGSMWHIHWPWTTYVGQWPIFHGPVILLYMMDKCHNWDIGSMWCKNLPNKYMWISDLHFMV